jgi:hypothetical protein
MAETDTLCFQLVAAVFFIERFIHPLKGLNGYKHRSDGRLYLLRPPISPQILIRSADVLVNDSSTLWGLRRVITDTLCFHFEISATLCFQRWSELASKTLIPGQTRSGYASINGQVMG